MGKHAPVTIIPVGLENIVLTVYTSTKIVTIAAADRNCE